MKERPILFSTPMVKAILEGKKTQTRRICKPATGWGNEWSVVPIKEEHKDGEQRYEIRNGTRYHLPIFKCPYGNVGDILWVRETFQTNKEKTKIIYKANNVGSSFACDPDILYGWKPSIFMPRSACRIRLEIVNIRIERVQNISEQDSIAEGIEKLFPDEPYCYKSYAVKETIHGVAPFVSYRTLWQKINGEKSWNENPFVWVIEFKKK